MSPYSIVKKHKNAVLRLICFPYAGGGTSIYRDWVNSMSPEVELLALQLPGREERFSEPLLTDLEQVMKSVTREFHKFNEKPYILFGYSMGARIAYELAVYAEKNGLKKPAHLIVGAAKPPHFEPKPIIYNLPDQEFIEEIRKQNGTHDDIINFPELMQLLLPRLKADYKIADTAPVRKRIHQLTCPVTAFSGDYDTIAKPEVMNNWNATTNTNFSINTFPDSHFFINSFKKQLITAVSTIVVSAINAEKNAIRLS